MRGLTVFVSLAFSALALGQSCPATSVASTSTAWPTATRAAPASASSWQTRSTYTAPSATRFAPTEAPRFRSLPPTAKEPTQEELVFLRTGPRLYPMDKALALERETGLPVVCWMGPNIFANEKARKASAKLGATTIQAAMDSDGEETDKAGKPLPVNRVKFSNGNYAPTASVKYIAADNLDDDSPAKILAFVRGAELRK